MRFEPIYQYRIWGGRRLAGLLSAPLRSDGSHRRSVAPERPRRPSEPSRRWPAQGTDDQAVDGAISRGNVGETRPAGFPRFPLLLKFLDTRVTLSVQVHPSDDQTDYIPAGESGKTEAWVVIEAAPDSPHLCGVESRRYRGKSARRASRAVPRQIAWPALSRRSGDSVLLPAGTVHSLGGLVVFEVQENSDVTFRLYDWDSHRPANASTPPVASRAGDGRALTGNREHIIRHGLRSSKKKKPVPARAAV